MTEINWTKELSRMIMDVEKHGVDTCNWVFLMPVDAYEEFCPPMSRTLSPLWKSCYAEPVASFNGREVVKAFGLPKGDVYFISREDFDGFVGSLKQPNPGDMSASFRYLRKAWEVNSE